MKNNYNKAKTIICNGKKRLTIDKKLCRLEKPQITKVSSYMMRRDSFLICMWMKWMTVKVYYGNE